MKNIVKLFSLITLAGMVFTSCDKVKDLPKYSNGKAVTLTSSATTIAAAPTDADKVVVTFTWTDPEYAQSKDLYKYVLEIDKENGSFIKAKTKTVTGTVSSLTLTGAELNKILLDFGFTFNVAGDIYVRLVSSYGNSNEAYASNVIKISAAPYKVPPKIAVPAELYIVGDLNGWNNNPGLDIRYKFSKIDETTFAGLFYFSGGGYYKLIQELGNWGTQFHMLPGGTPEGGEFEQKDADPAFQIPTTDGWYRVTVDFQNGKFSVKPGPARSATPANLYIVGSLNGWNNSGGLESKYHFTKTGEFTHELTLDVDAGGGIYKLIQELGNWGSQFRMIAGGTAFAGEFVQQDADPAFPLPDVAGRYKFTVDFAAGMYKVVKQ
jgi:starch-binding outer membrane protein SusE/F